MILKNYKKDGNNIRSKKSSSMTYSTGGDPTYKHNWWDNKDIRFN